MKKKAEKKRHFSRKAVTLFRFRQEEGFVKRIIPTLVAILCPSWIQADTIEVTSIFDEFDTPSGEFTSLREAIRDAGEMTEPCRIEILVTQKIKLDSPIVIPSGSMPIEISKVDRPFVDDTLVIAPSETFAGNSLFFSEDTRLAVSGLDFDLEDREITAFDVRGDEGFVLTRSKIYNSWRRPVWVGADTKVVISECEFEDLIGGAITINGSSEVSIKDSLFTSVAGICVGVQPSASTSVISLLNCTFAENLGGTAAVSISSSHDPEISIRHCSFVDNRMMPFRGPDTAEIDHTLFARNAFSSDPDTLLSIEENSIVGFGARSLGYNLTDSSPAAFDQSGDQVGTTVRISRLGHFGGRQRCCFPQGGSPAIDGGNRNRISFSPGLDVRGFERKAATSAINFPNTVDIGAVEANPSGTIVVANKNTDGPGSLKQALLDASDETNYIEFSAAAAFGVINLEDRIFVDVAQDTNINLNGQETLKAQLSSNDNTRSLIHFSVRSGIKCEVSFQRFSFRDLEEQKSDGRARAAVLVSGDAGGTFSFHKCEFTNNVFGGYAAISAHSRSDFYLNECWFLGNSVANVNETNNQNGSALRLDEGGSAEFRNCLFENNEADNGGVVRAGERDVNDKNASLRFENCTFVNNVCVGRGSCILAKDVSLERCTFAGNQGGSVIAMPNSSEQSRLEISRCLFYENEIGAQRVDSVELEVSDTSMLTLAVEGPSWTDQPTSYPGLFRAEDLGGNYILVLHKT